jgi:hypothetical protein
VFASPGRERVRVVVGEVKVLYKCADTILVPDDQRRVAVLAVELWLGEYWTVVSEA